MARQRRPEGPAPEPAVQKLRLRYAKRDRMRFTSTRDFQRALERAVRRAGLPMAYSGGFHPHPKISYANAAPTGAASESEYVEISLREQVDPEQVAPDLDAALPAGLDVLEVTDVTDAEGALADQLQASLWSMRFRGLRDTPEGEQLVGAVPTFLAQEELLVTRMMKKGPREIDVRAAVVDLVVDHGAAGAGDLVLLATVRHTTPTVRPEDIRGALEHVSGAPVSAPVATRLRQGPLVEGTVETVTVCDTA